MIENRPFGVKIRRLLTADRSHNLGKDVRQKPALPEQFQALPGVRRPEQLHQFIAETFWSYRGDLRGLGSESAESFRRDREVVKAKS